MSEYAVSVICVTYNQQDYIRQALDSILRQKTSFDYEVIVRDDASTDETSRIAQEYQTRHQGKVRTVINPENLFSKGEDFFKDTVENIATGKYIALCEGDDYWIDDNKLQLQYEALEKHPECDMCACQAVMVSEDGKHELGNIRPAKENRILSIEEVIMGGGMYLATNSLFFRKSMYDNMMEFEKIRSLDYVYQMKGALRGGIVYIDKPMAAYRRYSKGSQTVALTGENSVMSKQCEQEKEILRILDRETDGKYHDVITERINDYQISYYDQLMGNKDEIIKLLHNTDGNIYIWGLGLRGRDLEKFCNDINIYIAGAADIKDENVGGTTELGNIIISSSETMKNAEVILASVEGAYNYLLSTNFGGQIINMFKYMPRS